MGMPRLVVHVGAPKTASSAMQHGLRANRDRLARCGVHLPRTGTGEFAPDGASHHNLVWELSEPERFSTRRGGWRELAREVAETEAETVLLSSENFLSLLPGQRPAFEERLRWLSDDITIVICVREQLSLINSLYAQHAKILQDPGPFPDFVASQLADGTTDFDKLLAPWYDTSDITLRAIPFGGPDSPAPLAGLLDIVGVPTSADFDLEVDEVNPSLGPTGVEAARLLARHLTGRFPSFDHGTPVGQKLYRIARRAALKRGWYEDRFWGWTPDLAATVISRLGAANERFAHAVWGTAWPLAHPADRDHHSVRLEDLPPEQIQQVSRFVHMMTERYAQLCDDAASHRSPPHPQRLE